MSAPGVRNRLLAFKRQHHKMVKPRVTLSVFSYAQLILTLSLLQKCSYSLQRFKHKVLV